VEPLLLRFDHIAPLDSFAHLTLCPRLVGSSRRPQDLLAKSRRLRPIAFPNRGFVVQYTDARVSSAAGTNGIVADQVTERCTTVDRDGCFGQLSDPETFLFPEIPIDSPNKPTPHCSKLLWRGTDFWKIASKAPIWPLLLLLMAFQCSHSSLAPHHR
jgi:hypothetical protein